MKGYTNGNKNPNAAWWMEQVRSGMSFRKKMAHEERWETWRKYYRGQWKPGTLPANIFFRMLRTVVPRTYFRNPAVSIQATKPGIENMVFAQLIGRVDNKLLKSMKVKQQAKKIVQDAFLFGTGLGKLGFGAQFTPIPEILQNTEAPLSRGGGKVEYNAGVQANMPWFLRVRPGNFVVPNRSEDLQGVPWCAEWIRRPLEEVRDDPRLTNVKGLNPSTRSSHSFADAVDMDANMIDPGPDNLDMLEIHDKRMNKVIVLAPFSTDRVLYVGDDPLQHDRGVNYYDAVFNPDDEFFWGIPDSVILEPQQLEANDIRTFMMYHRKLSILKVLFKRGAIEEEEISKLLEGDSPMAAIEVVGQLSDIETRELGDIPDGLMKMDSVNMQDIRENFGFGRNQFGEFSSGSGDRTAHEAEIVRMASEIRVDERRDTMADMIVSLTKDLHHLLFTQWDEEMVIDVAGPAGVPFWVKFKPSMLKSGGFEISVDPDSSLPETKGMRQQRAVEVYGILQQNPLIDPMQLTQYLLREMHGIAFDGMIRMPQGLGGQGNPMDVGQFGQVMQQAAQAGLPQDNSQLLDALLKAGGA